MKHSTYVPFADSVFDERKMKRYLPAHTYNAIVAARTGFDDVSEKERDVYAKVLCKWARKKGATRYTHWFQPLNNCTAGKRDSMFSIDKDYAAVLKFRGKELYKGEGDASSFPSGGMRQIYEARGLTHWDYASYPFVKDECLYIPCTFCGTGGETLDKKTPLLKSCKALNVQALRVLRLLGEDVKQVYSVVGAEQEYFLIDKELFFRRPDLVYTGRTLFGAKPCKGQEFEDHYFCPPNEKTVKFMQEVDDELWRLGILAKTEHNEVAPCQHELAPCYTRVNVAADQNQLTMEVLKRVADKLGFACLLHEKPFANLNGSGKHNNWSLFTDKDENLFEAGFTPKQNARFLLMLAAVVKAADDYSELLTCAVSSRGNDCRLGGFEAPPRVLSVFLGEQIQSALKLVTGEKTHPLQAKWRYGVDILPNISQNTDRNRTSPFAFTGNKFELRSVGSFASVADVNTALNVAVAESLRYFADRMERATDVYKTAAELIAETFTLHRRVIFDGNCYSTEWAEEAKLRNLKDCSCVDAALALTNAHNVNVLSRHGVLTRREIAARQKILLQNYVNTVRVEGNVAVKLCREKIFGKANEYVQRLVAASQHKSTLGMDCQTELNEAEKLSQLVKSAHRRLSLLQHRLDLLQSVSDVVAQAQLCQDRIVPALESLRVPVDKLETLLPEQYWALPTYAQMLFGVK